LIALGSDAPPGRRDAVQALAKRVAYDPSAMQQILDVRERQTEQKKLDVKDLCARYLTAIEKVASVIDEALESTHEH
jgi:flagellar biosynthesis chaperone FliJ